MFYNKKHNQPSRENTFTSIRLVVLFWFSKKYTSQLTTSPMAHFWTLDISAPYMHVAYQTGLNMANSPTHAESTNP